MLQVEQISCDRKRQTGCEAATFRHIFSSWTTRTAQTRARFWAAEDGGAATDAGWSPASLVRDCYFTFPKHALFS